MKANRRTYFYHRGTQPSRRILIGGLAVIVLAVAGLAAIQISRAATTGGTSIALRWRAASAPMTTGSIKAYNIYRNGQKIATTIPNPSDCLNPTGTRYYDSNVARGQAYQYQITAISNSDTESAKSTTISATHSALATPIQVTIDTNGAPGLASWTQSCMKPMIET